MSGFIEQFQNPFCDFPTLFAPAALPHLKWNFHSEIDRLWKHTKEMQVFVVKPLGWKLKRKNLIHFTFHIFANLWTRCQ